MLLVAVAQVRVHVQSHVREEQVAADCLECGLCGETCGSPAGLMEHMNTMHRDGLVAGDGSDGVIGRRLYTCRKCSRTYQQSRNLRRHLQRAHGNVC